MSSLSVIIISSHQQDFTDLVSFLKSKSTHSILSDSYSNIGSDDLELIFNPVLLIDLEDTTKSEVSKLVERAQQQHMSFFFVVSSFDADEFEEYKLLKPAGYFIKAIVPELCYMDIEQELFNVSTSHLKTKKLEELFVKNGKDYTRISSDEILWIQASGNYIEIFTSNDKSYLLRVGLKDIEGRLPDEQFIRVHKSYIVNKKHILKFNSSSLKTQQGEVPIARSYFNAVLTAFTII